MALRVAVVAVASQACRVSVPPDDVDTGPEPDTRVRTEVELLDDGRPNLLLPMRVAVHPTQRRGAVVSLSMPTVAVWDLDTLTIEGVWSLGEDAVTQVSVPAIAEDGSVWLGSAGTPALARVDPASGDIDDLGLDATVSDVLALPDGSVAVAWQADETSHISIYGPDAAVLDTIDIEQPALGMALDLDGERLATLQVDGTATLLQVYDFADLSPGLSAAMDGAGRHLAPVGGAPADLWVVGGQELAWTVDLDTQAVTSVFGGEELGDVVALDDGFALLERNGDAAHDGPNWALLHTFDADGALLDTWVTGKHSTFMARDTQSGVLWMNSEGTTEVWAVEPATGEVPATIQLGVHVEHVLPLDDAGAVLATGRLSGTLARIDLAAETFEIVDDRVEWPTSPVWLDDTLWVLSGLDSVPVQLDPNTLDVVDTLDAGLPENTSLCISAMAAHPDRGTLLLTVGSENRLYELDPHTDVVVASWALAGEATSAEVPGRTEVLVGADALYTVRSMDGMLTRIEVGGEVTHTGQVSADLQDRLEGETMLQLASIDPAAGVLRVGPEAYALDDLSRADDADVLVDVVFAVREGGGVLGFRQDDDQLVAIADGDTERSWKVETLWTEPMFAWAPDWEDRVLHTDMGAAAVRSVPIIPEL